MGSGALLDKHEIPMTPILNEIGAVIRNAAKEQRDELDKKEIEYVLKLTNRMMKEYKNELVWFSKYS